MTNKQAQAMQPMMSPAVASASPLHPTLVPELLGFSPQMLLDDIISAAADAILQCLQAMEPFMQRWADTRTEAKEKNNESNKNGVRDDDWDGLEAVEQGLVAFQTLLEAHTDIAFDFFEAWSLRNIFALPADLPVVAPHQRGLDLDPKLEEESELMTDVEELRRKIENQRRLRRSYQKALRISRVGQARSERRLARLAYLAPSSPESAASTTTSSLDALCSLPPSVTALFESAAALPHLDGLASSLPLPPSALPGEAGAGARRPWEAGSQGYVAWAVAQLLVRARESASEGNSKGAGNVMPAGAGSTAVGDAAAQVGTVGQVKDVKGLFEEVKEVETERTRVIGEKMDTS